MKAHMKSLAMPVTWPIKKKGQKFIIRPNPGKKFDQSMPLSLLFKHILKYCKTTKEVKAILNEQEVLVDGKRRKEIKYPVGIMDVLSLPLTKEHYRMMITNKRKLYLLKISEKEANQKVAKITGKSMLPKKITQLHLSDGRNVSVKKDTYKVGDSVLMNLPDQKITDSFGIEKGNYAMLTGGSHTGEHGVIEAVDKLVKIKTKEGVFATPKEFVYVVGKKKPALTIEKSTKK